MAAQPLVGIQLPSYEANVLVAYDRGPAERSPLHAQDPPVACAAPSWISRPVRADS
jgi:hypothetical protein